MGQPRGLREGIVIRSSAMDATTLAVIFFAFLVGLALLWLVVRSAIISAIKQAQQEREAGPWLERQRRETF